MSRLYNILNKMIAKKKTVTLTTQTNSVAGTALVTDIPLTKPIVALYSSDRDGWKLFPMREPRFSDTNWCIGATSTMSGSYTVVIFYIDYSL